MDEAVWAIGMMSGTSLDGVDAALVKTNGETIEEFGPWLTVPYDEDFQELLRLAVHQSGDIPSVARDLTMLHARAVIQLLEEAEMKAKDVKVIGFHGQTIAHRPNHGITWQIGDGSLLASMTGIDVVCDFRSRDVAQGGQGAPLVPLFHAAIMKELPKPLAVLNIGGVANLTWIDKDGVKSWIQAFDTGPGNSLIDEIMVRRESKSYDQGGQLCMKGAVDEVALKGYMYDTFFDTPPPKTIDRYDFGIEPVMHLSTEDALATLVEFMVESVYRAQDFFYRTPRTWYVTGGGRHNEAIMKRLKERLGDVRPIEYIGYEGDALEAQAFAFLAMRSLRGLPLTLPEITGVRQPASGGAFYRA